MKLAAFDIEIAKIIPDGVDDLKSFAPLGIACAAIARSDTEEVEIWQGVPQMSQKDCQGLVERLKELDSQGYRILTWNGASFDFDVLSQESGMINECGAISMNHTDLMAIVTFTKGFYLGFDKALVGVGLSGKKKAVRLNSGALLSDMSGKQAPILWKAGEYAAVLEYLKADVTQLLALARYVDKKKIITWLSNRGNPQEVKVPKFYTLKECFQIPEPDTSWMSDPPSRNDFVGWIRDVGTKKNSKETTGVSGYYILGGFLLLMIIFVFLYK